MTKRNEIQAQQSVKTYTRKNARQLYYGTLGNNAGTVDHPTRDGWVYLRLHGDSDQVVEAFAAASFPKVAEVVVDVEKVNRKGAPYYQVLGVSAGVTYTTGDNPYANTPGAHAEHHQRRDRNTGGFDPLDVYNRALVNLRARAQVVPDLTCYVERGFYVITSFKEFAGGNSPAFTAPAGAMTTQRWDLLYLGNDDALHVLQGTAAPINPVYPTVPANCIPIAYVILSNSSTTIIESMITDARTILSSNQATATAHNLLSAVHTDTLTAAVVDGDVIIGNVTPAWSRLAISVPAAGTRNMLSVDNGELRPSWKADTIYSLVSGVRPFTGTVGGVTPVASTDLATKGYVDLAVSSLRLDEFFASTASDIGGIYYVMDENPAGAGTVVSAIISSNTTTNIFNFATLSGEPHLDRLVAGVYDIHAHLLKTGNRMITCYAELYKRVGAAETLLGTSSTTPALTAVDAFYDLYMTIATEIPLNLTDRLVLKWYAISANPAGDTTVTMTVGGTADPHMSIIVDPVELHTIFVPYTGSIHDTNLGTHTLTAAQLTATSTAPSVVLTDTTAAAKSLTIAVDANIADLRESAGASGSLLALDLANNRVGILINNPVTPLEIPGSTTNSSAKFGAFEIQSYAVNNAWIADNLYYNGGWKYRANGYAEQIYVTGGVIDFWVAPSGLAGAAVTRTLGLRVNNDGHISIGGTSNAGMLTLGSIIAPGTGTAYVSGHDGTGGFRFITKTSIDATAAVLIADGTGDVTKYAAFMFSITCSGGSSGTAISSVANGADQNLISLDGNDFNIRVNANGSLDIRRASATAGTITVAGWIIWI